MNDQDEQLERLYHLLLGRSVKDSAAISAARLQELSQRLGLSGESHEELSFESFKKIYEEELKEPAQKDLAGTFRMLDTDHDGVVLISDLKKLLEKMGLQMDEDRITRVLQYSGNFKGTLTESEFIDFFYKNM